MQSSLRFSQVKICQILQNQVVVLIKKINSVLREMLLWSLRIWCCSAFNPQPPVCLNVKKKKAGSCLILKATRIDMRGKILQRRTPGILVLKATRVRYERKNSAEENPCSTGVVPSTLKFQFVEQDE